MGGGRAGARALPERASAAGRRGRARAAASRIAAGGNSRSREPTTNSVGTRSARSASSGCRAPADARVALIEGAGHSPYVEKPDEGNAPVEGFLDAREGGAPA
jgi:hypothetical protein